MNPAALLDRLKGVRSTGPGRWIAKCPAHDDRSPSLSIRALEDGTLLLKCFAGCCVQEVVADLGLKMSDLFPPRVLGVHRIIYSKPTMAASDAVASLDHETQVVALIATDVLEHRAIDEETWQRLARAAHRIGEVRAAVTPLRIKP